MKGVLLTNFLIVVFILIEWLGREKQYAIQFDNSAMPRIVRWSFYYIIILVVLGFGGNQQEFIYFQF